MSSGLPATGTTQTDYRQHMIFDAPSLQANGVVTESYQENLFGHRSGIGGTHQGGQRGLSAYSGSQPKATSAPLDKDNWWGELRMLGNPSGY